MDDKSLLGSAYRERNQLVSALSRLFEAHLAVDEGGEPGWQIVVCVHLPVGQGGWHVGHADLDLFSHLEFRPNDYDGHTTEIKYERLAALAQEKPYMPHAPSSTTTADERFYRGICSVCNQWVDVVGAYVAFHRNPQDSSGCRGSGEPPKREDVHTQVPTCPYCNQEVEVHDGYFAVHATHPGPVEFGTQTCLGSASRVHHSHSVPPAGTVMKSAVPSNAPPPPVIERPCLFCGKSIPIIQNSPDDPLSGKLKEHIRLWRQNEPQGPGEGTRCEGSFT